MKKSTSFFLALFLSITLVTTTVAPAFAQLGTPAVPAPEPVVAPPPAVEVTPAPVVQVITPPADTTAPAISGVASLSLGITDATIAWTTDELAISHLEYGTTENYGSQATVDATALLAHTAILTGLAAHTTYYYCIHATDLAGNTSNSCGHLFTTAAESVIVDTTPPNVTLITEGPITTTQATIGFTTSEVGNARIEYGTTAGYGQTTPLDTNLALTHSVILSNLTPHTEYHYRIISSDQIGNGTITSDETFMTEAVAAAVVVGVPTDTVPPMVSGVGSVTLGLTDVTLAWTTNELAVSTLEYGTTQNYGLHATLSVTAELAHTATLTGLVAGTTYYYCIHATDLAANTTNSCPHSFTTEPAAVIPPTVAPATDTAAPQISLITTAPITTSAATISWTTNELATSQIQYGTTASYGATTNLGGSAALTHSVTLSALSSDTTYHYRLISTDVSGNIGLSSDETFTTSALPPVQTQVSADTVAPVVSGVGSVALGITDATLAWTTNELAVSTLVYGTTSNYGSQATLALTAGLAHTATLTGLTGGTTYYYCVHATDLAGNATNSCPHSFTTEPTPVIPSVTVAIDTAAPQISLITVAPITTTGATITWTTNELAASQIQYGTTASYGQTSSLGTTPALIHSVTLSALALDTTYHYRLTSTDAAGNSGLSSDETFTTSALPQVQSQASTVIISGIDTTSVSTSTVTIAWNTDLPSDSQIEYGDSDNLGSLTALDSTLTTSHSVTIAGLASNTNYIFRVKSKPLGATVATVSGNDEFDTLNHTVPVVAGPNILSVASSDMTGTGTTVSWTTDKAATSQVEYGISTSYGEASTLNTAMATTHSIPLTNLESGTTYHFRVKSTDEVSNVTFSEDYTFTTTIPSSSVSTNQGGSQSNNVSGSLGVSSSVPAAVTTLAVGAYDKNSAALVWHVVSSSSDVAASYNIRYSTSPITELNFASATEAQLTPIYHGDLSPNDTERTYIVAGLDPSMTYYFALESKHENSSYSDISNVVTITTSAGASVSNESATSNTSGSSAPAPSSSGSGGGGGGGSVSISSGYGVGSGGNAQASYIPTLMKAEPADNQIIFEWDNPGEVNFVRTVIVRKEGDYPTSPSDGRTLYEGREKTFTDTNVQNGTRYYYALYSYNHDKTYSNPIHVSLVPLAANKEVKFNESGSFASSTPALHFVRTWQKGDKDIEIEHLQEILVADKDSYPEKYVTGYFGSLTQAALKRFQAKHGLSQTGVVDVATQNKLNTVSHSETILDIPTDYVFFHADLKYGDQGDTVKDLQQYLIYEGSYAEAIISGYFGNYTHKAVKIFQSRYAIQPVSGFVGYKTRHRMQQLTGL